MRRIFILVVLLIIYGSLYPWHFAARQLPANPLWILWHSWDPRFSRFLLRDTVVNVALYVPLGMSGYLAFRSAPGFSMWLPVLLGFILSVSMELLQLFVPGRTTSADDVLTNVAGAAIGMALGLVFERMSGARRRSAAARRSQLNLADRSALLLLFIWTGVLFFPFFPVVGSSAPIHRIRVFSAAPLFAAVPLISAAVSWLAAGKLMEAAGIRSSRLLLGLSVLAVPVQFFLADRQPLPSDLLGALSGFLLFAGIGHMGLGRMRSVARRATPWIAVAFLLAILVRGFAPFHFVSQAADFGWIPFGGFLNTEWQYGLLVLLEKSFYYGTAIWLLRASGVRLAFAALITAVALMAIEIAQIHLPARTAEVTDPLVAIVLAFALGILSRETPRRRNLRVPAGG